MKWQTVMFKMEDEVADCDVDCWTDIDWTQPFLHDGVNIEELKQQMEALSKQSLLRNRS